MGASSRLDFLDQTVERECSDEPSAHESDDTNIPAFNGGEHGIDAPSIEETSTTLAIWNPESLPARTRPTLTR